VESHHDLISLFEHDLFGKPVSTFPDHALTTGFLDRFRRQNRPPVTLSPAQKTALKRDEFRSNRHRALAYCLRMIFSENRCTLFRIMR
jgi:hypothetical protein